MKWIALVNVVSPDWAAQMDPGRTRRLTFNERQCNENKDQTGSSSQYPLCKSQPGSRFKACSYCWCLFCQHLYELLTSLPRLWEAKPGFLKSYNKVSKSRWVSAFWRSGFSAGWPLWALQGNFTCKKQKQKKNPADMLWGLVPVNAHTQQSVGRSVIPLLVGQTCVSPRKRAKSSSAKLWQTASEQGNAGLQSGRPLCFHFLFWFLTKQCTTFKPPPPVSGFFFSPLPLSLFSLVWNEPLHKFPRLTLNQFTACDWCCTSCSVHLSYLL